MGEVPSHKVELNFYYIHRKDAFVLTDISEKERTKLRSLYARHAIISVVFAGEALISRLSREYRYHSKQLFPQRPEKKYAKFPDFQELVDIRNWFVHSSDRRKDQRFVEASMDGSSTITLEETGEEIPWIDVREGATWPRTSIPLNPFELTADHAKEAIRILDDMVSKLKGYLPDIFADAWLDQIKLCEKQSQTDKQISVDNLWGGYTPKNSKD
jgi:hypothetical protein